MAHRLVMARSRPLLSIASLSPPVSRCTSSTGSSRPGHARIPNVNERSMLSSGELGLNNGSLVCAAASCQTVTGSPSCRAFFAWTARVTRRYWPHSDGGSHECQHDARLLVVAMNTHDRAPFSVISRYRPPPSECWRGAFNADASLTLSRLSARAMPCLQLYDAHSPAPSEHASAACQRTECLADTACASAAHHGSPMPSLSPRAHVTCRALIDQPNPLPCSRPRVSLSVTGPSDIAARRSAASQAPTRSTRRSSWLQSIVVATDRFAPAPARPPL